MLVKKYTLLVDAMWEKEILEKMYPFVEADECFQLLDETEIEVCTYCQIYLTKDDGEVIMDVFKCPDNQEYCLNCCGCPDHDGEKWY